jgi:hypothetical protein
MSTTISINDILDFCFGVEVELLEPAIEAPGALSLEFEVLEAQEVWEEGIDIKSMSTAARMEILELAEAFFSYAEEYLDQYDVDKCDTFVYELQELLGQV